MDTLYSFAPNHDTIFRKDNEDLDDEFFDKDDTSVAELESTMELDRVKEEMNRKAKVCKILIKISHKIDHILLVWSIIIISPLYVTTK